MEESCKGEVVGVGEGLLGGVKEGEGRTPAARETEGERGFGARQSQPQ